MHRLISILFALNSLLLCSAAFAKAPSVAVVYPEIRDPYRAVFLEIVRGMEAELGRPVAYYQLSGQPNAAEALVSRMKNDHIDVVVTLGRAGYEAADSLAKSLPVVIGAVSLRPGQDLRGLPGISLAPDPAILFARLKDLMPDTRNITVIYDPNQGIGEITRAKEAARAAGLTLQALPAENLRLSAGMYQKVLADIKDGSVAVWLPQDNAAMDDQALLPMVLKEAWLKRFVVFSSSLDHVRKGALFSLYPDNYGMGRRLAVMARNRTQAPSNRSAAMEPLRDVLTAVNLRTAEHLGLRFSQDTLQKFGLTFPPRP